MRLNIPSVAAVVLASISAVQAASWSFSDASVTVKGKGVGVPETPKQKFSSTSHLTSIVTFGPTEALRVVLTTTEDGEGKRPHQAFLTLQDTTTGLEESYPLDVQENGKGKVEVTHKDLPNQLLTSSTPLKASLVIASFGSSSPSNTFVFNVAVNRDTSVAQPAKDTPLRYGKLSEINHIPRADPKSPPLVITLVFTGLALATFPILLGAWFALGANANHLSEAMNKAPVAHALFLVSIFGMEGIFFMYYSSWTLFQTLPPAGVAGVVAIVSGSRALGEVQARRLAGKR